MEKFVKKINLQVTNRRLISFYFIVRVGFVKNNLLKPLIQKIKNQDMNAFVLIFEEFKKLITFYGVRLHYEDAASELTLFLIELLYGIDLEKFLDDDSDELHRYIAVSIKNKYISLSMAKTKKLDFESEFFEERFSCSDEMEDRFCFIKGVGRLNEVQKLILVYHFVYGYSIAEIAERLNVTRQTANKIKNQALAILREALMKDEAFFL